MIESEDIQELVTLLRHDVTATIDETHDDIIHAMAFDSIAVTSSRDDYIQTVVDNLQQYFHDTFVDTTWPRCPDHSNHPLWFHDGWWLCERSKQRVAKLGDLTLRLPR